NRGRGALLAGCRPAFLCASGDADYSGAWSVLFSTASDSRGTNAAGRLTVSFGSAGHEPHVPQAPLALFPVRRRLRPRRMRKAEAPAMARSATTSCQSKIGILQLHSIPIRYAAKAPT